jgi:uncharacterized protein Usg
MLADMDFLRIAVCTLYRPPTRRASTRLSRLLPQIPLDRSPACRNLLFSQIRDHRETEGKKDHASERGSMSNLSHQLRGYRLTTAEILYRLPDHPVMLQSFIWQEMDLAPKFPALQKFLHFWETNLDGKLYSVRVASARLINDSDLKLVGREFALH